MAEQQNKKPWIQRKSTLIGGFVVIVLLAVVVSVTVNPSPRSPSAREAAGQGVQGLGTAGQSAEFNQTFATRLREDQAREIERMKREMNEQLDSRVAAEGTRIRAEVTQGNQALLQRLDEMSKSQQEAAEAARQPSAQRTLQFKSPAARSGESGVRPLTGADAVPDPRAGAGTPTTQPVIPPNGFVTGRLLNGVVATVGEQPTHFLVALEGQYKAANGFVVNLNGCMASVEARANLAAGRIDGKPAEITCNFPSQGRVQTWPVAGWVVDDQDGIRGLSASIVDNTGKKITASALAAALGTAGAALSGRQFTTTTGGGGTSSTLTGNPSEVLMGGAVAGAGQGLTAAVNEHFALYKPTLQKGGGSPVTLVIANELAVPPEGAHITRNTGVGAGAAGDRKQP